MGMLNSHTAPQVREKTSQGGGHRGQEKHVGLGSQENHQDFALTLWVIYATLTLSVRREFFSNNNA